MIKIDQHCLLFILCTKLKIIKLMCPEVKDGMSNVADYH